MSISLTLHHSAREIGGNAIEVAGDETRLLLDFGIPLDKEGGPPSPMPKIAGLYPDSTGPRPDAILLSHIHLDHWGRMPKADSSIPIYMGAESEKILRTAVPFQPGAREILRWLDKVEIRPIERNSPFKIGEFQITPIHVDHSVMDSFAFLIEGKYRRIFYTGDLRLHGRKVGMKHRLLNLLKKSQPVDIFICEGTALGRGSWRPKPEYVVEDEVRKLLTAKRRLVLFQFSPLNLDRLVSFIRASMLAKPRRVIVIDAYTASIIERSSASIPGLGLGVKDGRFRVFLPPNIKKASKDLRPLIESKGIEPEEINRTPENFLMLVRPSYTAPYLIDDFGKVNLEGSILIYSLWSGYRRQDTQIKFEKELMRLGLEEVVEAHTSGHISSSDLDLLLRAAKAKTVIPNHTENPEAFLALGPEESEIVVAENGVPLEF